MKRTCDFCYRLCCLSDGQKGVCGVRQNQAGRLVSLGWGNVVALASDPVEKKPLYHFLPGTHTLSFALFGCNFRCSFCQNYTISQQEYYSQREGRPLEPREIVDLALSHGSPSISFTYSEPLVWQDYLCEVARLAKEAALMTIMVTNGSFSAPALERLLPLIDAFNVDLKGDESFYRRVCKASREPVLAAIEAIVEAKRHLEVTTMVTESDHTPAVMETLATELKTRGVEVWHLSRYVPRYRYHDRATSEEFLAEAVERARESGIPHVYAGNSAQDTSTYCPHCHALLIRRGALRPVSRVAGGCCPECGHRLYGHFPA